MSSPITGHKGLEGKQLPLDQMIESATSKDSVTKPDEESKPDETATDVNVLDPAPVTFPEDEVLFEDYVPVSPKPGPSSASRPYIEPETKRPRLLYVEPQKENIPPTTGNGERYSVTKYLLVKGIKIPGLQIRVTPTNRFTIVLVCFIQFH